MSTTGLRLNVGHVSCMPQRLSFLIRQNLGSERLEKVPG